jgi:IS5 family transposase
MKYLKCRFRDIIDILKEMPGIRRILCLKKLPHFTTINKFLKRISLTFLNVILQKTLNMFRIQGIVAIDSTSFSSSNSSRHYSMISYRYKKHVWKNSYMKNSLCIDVETQAVITDIPRNRYSHDINDAEALLKRTRKIVKMKTVLADKGYDSEELHRFIRHELKAESVIPLRVRKRKRKLKRFRRKMQFLDKKLYNKRSLVETVFSVMKRRFGDILYSRSLMRKKKELKLVCIVYNVHRYMKMCCLLVRISTQLFKRKVY